MSQRPSSARDRRRGYRVARPRRGGVAARCAAGTRAGIGRALTVDLMPGGRCARQLRRRQLGYRTLLGRSIRRAGNSPRMQERWTGPPDGEPGTSGALDAEGPARGSGWRPLMPIRACRRTGSRSRWRLNRPARICGRGGSESPRRAPRYVRWTERYAAERDPIHGASLGFSAALYTELGGFRSLRSGEDRDLHHRAVAAGFRIAYDPRAAVTTSSRRNGPRARGFCGRAGHRGTGGTRGDCLTAYEQRGRARRLHRPPGSHPRNGHSTPNSRSQPCAHRDRAPEPPHCGC